MSSMPQMTSAPLIHDAGLEEALKSGRTLPSNWYTDDAIFDLERERIFDRSWDYVGHRSQVASAGSYFTSVAGSTPIIVVCGKDAIVRAFLNVCRHRKCPVAEGAGKQPRLVCKYHAWSYDLDGSLAAAPRSREDPNFDPAALSLEPIAIDFLGDMIFVNPDRSAPPLREVLEPIPALAVAHGIPLETAVFREMRSIEMDANWKLAWDNNSECYHCPTIHNAWFREAKLGPDAVSGKPIGPYHFQHVMDTRPDSPIDNHFFCWPTFTLATDSSSGPGYAERPGEANRRDGSHLGFFLWRWIPLSARKTRIELNLFTVSPLSADVADAWYTALLSVLSEDKEICETLQASHEFGKGELGTLIPAVDSEHQIQVWQLLIYRALSKDLPIYHRHPAL